MTARLQRLYTLLRAGNVPCALDSRPGLGRVLVAGTPDSGAWDVIVRDNGSALWVHDAHGVEQVPHGWTDAAAADTVKFHVVRAWADQGDEQAKAVIATLDGTPWRQQNARQQNQPPADLAVITVYPFFNPFQFAGQMVTAANQFANLFLSRQPTMVNYSLWSPWGRVQGGYLRP